MIAVNGGMLLSLCFFDIRARRLFRLMSFLGFVGSCRASCSWTKALATSEQALKYRSFSGGKFNSLGFLRLSDKVIVSVAISATCEKCPGGTVFKDRGCSFEDVCSGTPPNYFELGEPAFPGAPKFGLAKTRARVSCRRLSFKLSRESPPPQFKPPLTFPCPASIVFDKMQALSRCARPAMQAAVRRQGYATATSAYAATNENLRINKDTKVIYQGFTGKQGT